MENIGDYEMLFNEVGNLIVKEYSDVLGIGLIDSYRIIAKNKAAKLYLQQEKVLKLTSKTKVLGLILRATLLRSVSDFSKITDEEINFVKKNYNIDIDVKQKIRLGRIAVGNYKMGMGATNIAEATVKRVARHRNANRNSGNEAVRHIEAIAYRFTVNKKYEENLVKNKVLKNI